MNVLVIRHGGCEHPIVKKFKRDGKLLIDE